MLLLLLQLSALAISFLSNTDEAFGADPKPLLDAIFRLVKDTDELIRCLPFLVPLLHAVQKDVVRPSPGHFMRCITWFNKINQLLHVRKQRETRGAGPQWRGRQASAAAAGGGGRSAAAAAAGGGGRLGWSAEDEEVYTQRVLEMYGKSVVREAAAMLSRPEKSGRKGAGRREEQSGREGVVERQEQQQLRAGKEEEEEEGRIELMQVDGEVRGGEFQGQHEQQQQRERQYVSAAMMVIDARGGAWVLRDLIAVMMATGYSVQWLNPSSSSSGKGGGSSSSTSGDKRRAMEVMMAVADMLMPIAGKLHPRLGQKVVEAFAAVGLKEHPVLGGVLEGLARAVEGSTGEGGGGESGLAGSPAAMVSLGEALHKLGKVLQVTEPSRK